MKALKIGARVELTDEARRTFSTCHSHVGTVVSVDVVGGLIRVHRDGIKRPDRWSATFWRPAPLLEEGAARPNGDGR